MKLIRPSTRLLAIVAATLPALLSAQSSLTIYNQNFAVVRDTVPLDLKAGDNVVPYTGVSAQLEPDSVVLRDPAGKVPLQILDQSYRSDVLSQGYLLMLNEGKTIDFIVRDKDNKEYKVQGKIISSGYVPPDSNPNVYMPRNGGAISPIIQVDGQLRFSLPGEPVFPALGDNTILKPTLTWRIATAAAAKFDAELSYVSNGLSWQAAYNIIAPEKGDTLDLIGWVTLQNNSGKEFKDAAIKLLAGDVNRIQPANRPTGGRGGAGGGAGGAMAPPVTEKTFDEYHLYTLTHPETLMDRETKQVEFIRATNIKSQTLYVYDGVALDNYRNVNPASTRTDLNYGTQSNKKVWVMREFKNSKENNLGIPLPAGRIRFYRRDDTDNHLEFTGENTLDHTPEGETIRLYTGDSFDLVGERARTDYQQDSRANSLQETFQIKVRNHKTEPVEIRVVEHLYRWNNWIITVKSTDYIKTDAQTIEFRVTLKPEEEKVVDYTVRYSW